MKRIACIITILLVFSVTQASADPALFLNAFGETATAYLNDSFLLLGSTADGYVADILKKETALQIATNVQKRIRIIRAKLTAVSKSRIAEADKQLLNLLDRAYACMDHQAWTLISYINEKTPEAARRFEEQRTECLSRLEKISEFYATLPPSPQLPEPLSTR